MKLNSKSNNEYTIVIANTAIIVILSGPSLIFLFLISCLPNTRTTIEPNTIDKPTVPKPTNILDNDAVAAYINVIMIVPANALPNNLNDNETIGTTTVATLIGVKTQFSAILNAFVLSTEKYL